jgi:hypothetical protein
MRPSRHATAGAANIRIAKRNTKKCGLSKALAVRSRRARPARKPQALFGVMRDYTPQ